MRAEKQIDTDPNGMEGLENPDATYNHTTWDWYWLTNEDRTLKMEEKVFTLLQSDLGKPINDTNSNPITFASLKGFLVTWNKIVEIGDLASLEAGKSEKLTALNDELSRLFGKKIEIPPYRQYIGLGCRLKYLGDASLISSDGMTTTKGKTDYPYAILDTTTKGAKECTTQQP